MKTPTQARPEGKMGSRAKWGQVRPGDFKGTCGRHVRIVLSSSLYPEPSDWGDFTIHSLRVRVCSFNSHHLRPREE
jgi:hypothetical protein